MAFVIKSGLEADAPHAVALLRARRERPRHGATEPGDEFAPSCMTREEHSERRRESIHESAPVATGSPRPSRITNRE